MDADELGDDVAQRVRQRLQVMQETREPPPGFGENVGVAEFAEWLRSIGAIQTLPDLKPLVDDSYRQYALSQVKLT